MKCLKNKINDYYRNNALINLLYKAENLISRQVENMVWWRSKDKIRNRVEWLVRWNIEDQIKDI